MFYIADLHIHSHYAQATSKHLNLETLYQWARVKGIHVIGTGDFTHPAWLHELQEKLIPDGHGFFRLKNPPLAPAIPGLKIQDIDVRFCLSTEISCVYTYDGILRKNHHLVYVPDFETAMLLNKRISHTGDLAADGRPTINLSSRDLLEVVLNVSPRAHFVPAHVWTPWFSTLGSRGGYDSVSACFRDLTPHIFALETGLSSDPDMNRQWSELDQYTMLSNSDAHSPQKIGREATVFNADLSYDAFFNAIKTGEGFGGTYEFFPEEGKYFRDGHRNCGISFTPQQSAKHKGICPVCGKPLTIGVLNRVEKLVDRPPVKTAGFKYIIPLPEILSELNGVSTESKKVQEAFRAVLSVFGNEFNILNEVPVQDITRYHPLLGEGIRRMRNGEVQRIAGYDGVYGTIRLFSDDEPKTNQLSIF
jgi:DNA helicase-2/ATP-dependent DNA helicase PcrA